MVVSKIKGTEKHRITYAEYMNIVLYDQEVGYYMKDKKKLGTEGDFYTSSGVHSVFGRAFAHFFLDLIEKEQLPASICEFGGGDGRFAKAVFDEWELITNNRPLHYTMIETSPYHRKEQKKLLSGKVDFRQFASLEELQESDSNDFEGIIFSNELLDAFPVHVVEKQQSNLFEVFVTIDDVGNLVEIKEICSNEQINDWLRVYGPTLKEGQRIEVPIYMNSWITSVDNFLKRGHILTIDYGYTKEDWSMPQRKDGSLRGYFKHQMINNPLEHPTEMDLTTHIHLDAYEMMMEEIGLEKLVAIKQNRFLLMIGMLKFVQENYDSNPFSEKSKLNRAVKTLITDTGMSAAFHVFLHGKNVTNSKAYRIFNDDPYQI
ncbi:SAM-dependent methyltransferase [Anaerobacillus sp. CMMVII]|uniref:SAM-dependent methyltransferase n=1 Tax=Anaerobacillus sp. CMMVII TaxID=2755588 RepID=UPI0021B7FF1A|nr:SAM-dependent methyltransferase [Anaerobacillus sp. CMMVII]